MIVLSMLASGTCIFSGGAGWVFGEGVGWMVFGGIVLALALVGCFMIACAWWKEDKRVTVTCVRSRVARAFDLEEEEQADG